MSKLTDLQLKLADLLKALRISKDSAIAIALMLQEDKQIVAFAKCIKENMLATESELIAKVIEIAEEKNLL